MLSVLMMCAVPYGICTLISMSVLMILVKIDENGGKPDANHPG